MDDREDLQTSEKSIEEITTGGWKLQPFQRSYKAPCRLLQVTPRILTEIEVISYNFCECITNYPNLLQLSKLIATFCITIKEKYAFFTSILIMTEGTSMPTSKELSQFLSSVSNSTRRCSRLNWVLKIGSKHVVMHINQFDYQKAYD